MDRVIAPEAYGKRALQKSGVAKPSRFPGEGCAWAAPTKLIDVLEKWRISPERRKLLEQQRPGTA
ncbi:MAG TPA: hypothetical protein VFV82_13705 [Candidatus Binatia bacterium]|nr:hypothetical protein [Candidatus Binatia bacterium]